MLLKKLSLLVFLFFLGCAHTKPSFKFKAENAFFEKKPFVEEGVFVVHFPSAVSLQKTARIHIRDFSFKGSLQDFVSALSFYRIPCSVSENNKLTVNVPYFNGTFLQLAQLLSNTYGLVFKEVNDVVSIKQKDVFLVEVPNFPDKLIKAVLAQMNASGIENPAYSPASGCISWKGNALTLPAVKKIITGAVKSYARVDFDVVAFESSFSSIRDFKLGLDTIIKKHNFRIHPKIGSTESSSSSGISTQEVQPASVSLEARHFNLLFKALIRKGKARVIQKVFLSTANLMPASFEFGKSTPYVEKVETAYLQGVSGTSYTTTTPQVEVTFGEALSGVKLEIKPIFIRALKSVFSKISVSINNVERMIKVQAGQFAYMRPETTKRVLKNNLLMKLGKIYVIGGFELAKRNATKDYLPPAWRSEIKGGKMFFAIRPVAKTFAVKEK